MIVEGNVFTFYAQLVYLIALGWMILRAQKGLKTPEVHKLPGLDAGVPQTELRLSLFSLLTS